MVISYWLSLPIEAVGVPEAAISTGDRAVTVETTSGVGGGACHRGDTGVVVPRPRKTVTVETGMGTVIQDTLNEMWCMWQPKCPLTGADPSTLPLLRYQD